MIKHNLVLIMLTIISQFTMGQNQNTAEKRSTIVEVDGYAYLSEDKTIRQIKEEAFTNAKRAALERTQTYIKSLTTVENFQLTYDLIQSGAEGFVKILESKDFGITSENRYHVWIKTEVEYSLKKPDMQIPANITQSVNAPLSVLVWTEKKEFKAGEKIQILLKGNKDFYARVVYNDVSGNLLQILPNQHRKDNFFKGGQQYVIPDANDKFDLEVSEPFGQEQVIVYASTASFGEANVSNFGNDLFKVEGGLKDFGLKSRGIKIKEKPAEFYEVKYILFTQH